MRLKKPSASNLGDRRQGGIQGQPQLRQARHAGKEGAPLRPQERGPRGDVAWERVGLSEVPDARTRGQRGEIGEKLLGRIREQTRRVAGRVRRAVRSIRRQVPVLAVVQCRKPGRFLRHTNESETAGPFGGGWLRGPVWKPFITPLAAGSFDAGCCLGAEEGPGLLCRAGLDK